jgi:hypothetical protein
MTFLMSRRAGGASDHRFLANIRAAEQPFGAFGGIFQAAAFLP